MKYMIIKGAKNSGKSVTVKEICKRLKPSALKQINFNPQGAASITAITGQLLNGDNYIASVKGKNILLIATSPTEQKTRATEILEAVKALEVEPEFAIIAMCGLEKLKDFATAKELENYGQCVYETKIWRIPALDYVITDEWDKRITHLTSVAKHYL